MKPQRPLSDEEPYVPALIFSLAVIVIGGGAFVAAVLLTFR